MNNKIKLSITGKNPTYFLKEIIKRNINIYKVEKDHSQLQVIIDYENLEEIMKIKTTYKIKIVERYGLSKYKALISKYKYFLLFLAMGIILNLILSNIIFDIEVIHSNKELINKVKKDLYELGLKKYHLKVPYAKKESIKEKLLSKEKDLLEWVEIEEKGTKYIVKVEQRKKNKKEQKCNYRHIISKKNALITEILADSGEIVKKKNDYVEKGEVLISGLIHNKEDVVSKRCATGKVYGEVWYSVVVSIPKVYHSKQVTDEKKYGIYINFLGNEYNLLNKFSTYEKYEYNIIDSKIVPLNISFARYTRTKESTKNIDLETVDKEALNVASKKIKKQLKNGEAIISKKVLKKTEINSKIRVEVFFKIKEDITSYQDITNLNIEEMNKKEGD